MNNRKLAFLSLLGTVLLFLSSGNTEALAQRIRSIDITVEIQPDGSALVTQEWDVKVVKGTEWYVPVRESGGVRIRDLHVSEDGKDFTYEGRSWDTSRTITQKEGRCGLNPTAEGVELCWGIGSLGDHEWTVRFTIEGLVQSLRDADAFNFMFVNPGMVASVENVTVKIINATSGAAWTPDNVKYWGFGCEGTIELEDGAINLEASYLEGSDSVIIMCRFDKGLLSPEVSRDISFDEMRDMAMEGNTYYENVPDNGPEDISTIVTVLIMAGLAINYVWKRLKKKIALRSGKHYRTEFFGTKKVDGYFREAPLGGDLPQAFYVLEKGDMYPADETLSNLIGAYFLKWILNGYVRVSPDPKDSKRVQMTMTDRGAESFKDGAEARLYAMAMGAARANGNDILEASEFRNWSRSGYDSINSWKSSVLSTGLYSLQGQGLMSGLRATQGGMTEFNHLIQFKNFLEDFTLSKERGSSEVGLWTNYLIYAALFGIADKVAEQFKKLYPEQFQQFSGSYGYDPYMMTNSVLLAKSFATTSYYQTKSVREARAAAARASSGGGGFTSRGGGGGFSGGGFGGGSR